MSRSSVLVEENSETMAPSAPPWNQCQVLGGMVYCSPISPLQLHGLRRKHLAECRDHILREHPDLGEVMRWRHANYPMGNSHVNVRVQLLNNLLR